MQHFVAAYRNILQVFESDSKTGNIVARILLELVRITPPQNAPWSTEISHIDRVQTLRQCCVKVPMERNEKVLKYCSGIADNVFAPKICILPSTLPSWRSKRHASFGDIFSLAILA